MRLYYRLRRKGALVFRMEVFNRQRRIELNQVAAVLADGAASDWWRDWCARRDAARLSGTERFMADLNSFTDWMAREAPDAEIAALSDPLLMALPDLRQVVVRRLSEVEAERPLAPDGQG